MKRVLFVDDEPWFVRPWFERLEMEGYDVTYVNAPQAAIDILENDRDFSLIIADIIMPSSDEEAGHTAGLLLAEEIRKKGITTPILFFTVVSDIAIRQKAEHLKVAFITKTASMRTFLNRVATMTR